MRQRPEGEPVHPRNAAATQALPALRVSTAVAWPRRQAFGSRRIP